MIRPAEDLALYRADMAAWAAGAVERSWQKGDRRLGAGQRRVPARHPRPARRRPDRCRPGSFRTCASSRGVRPGGPTTATSASCWSSWCCGARSRSPGGRATTGCGTWPSRVYPDDPGVPAEEARRIRNERRLRPWASPGPAARSARSSRWTSARSGEPAVVDGVKGQWRVEPVTARPAVQRPGGAVVAVRPADPRPQAPHRALRVRLPARDVQAGRRSVAGATSRCRSCTPTGSSASSTQPPTARPACSGSTPSTATSSSPRR